MSNQRGEAAAKLLFLLLICAIAGAVASPWLLRSRRTAEQLAAVADLRAVHGAQQAQYGATMLYADLDRLAKGNLLEPGFQSRAVPPRGYALHHSVDGTRKRFCAEMVAKGIKDVTFAIDETGFVMEYPEGSAPCNGGILQTAGTPVR